MNREAYFAGAYAPSSGLYRMAMKKWGAIPAAPVVEEKVAEKPVEKPKAAKKTAKKKTKE